MNLALLESTDLLSQMREVQGCYLNVLGYRAVVESYEPAAAGGHLWVVGGE